MSRALTHSALLVAALAAAACTTDDKAKAPGGTSSSGAGEESNNTPAPPVCGELGEQFLSAACRDCAIARCCEELEACDTGSDCSAVDACLGSACADTCPVSAGVCDTGVNLGSAACDACLTQSCCAPVQNCLAVDACRACLLTGDGDCTSSPLLDDARDCALDNCTSACEA